MDVEPPPPPEGGTDYGGDVSEENKMQYFLLQM